MPDLSSLKITRNSCGSIQVQIGSVAAVAATLQRALELLVEELAAEKR